MIRNLGWVPKTWLDLYLCLKYRRKVEELKFDILSVSNVHDWAASSFDDLKALSFSLIDGGMVCGISGKEAVFSKLPFHS